MTTEAPRRRGRRWPKGRRVLISPTALLGTVGESQFLEDGCNLASCCFECPLPLCQYDLPVIDDDGRRRDPNAVWWVVTLVFLDDVDERLSDDDLTRRMGAPLSLAPTIRKAAHWIREKLSE